MSKSGLCIIFTYWFIIQVKDQRKMQNGPYAINDITDSWIIVPLGPAEIIHVDQLSKTVSKKPPPKENCPPFGCC